MGIVTYSMLQVLDNVFSIDTFWGVLGQGFFAGIIGIVIAVFILIQIGNPEIISFWRAVKHKFWRKADLVAGGE